jgi:DNA-binding MarR family transcriptional regulator
VKTALATQAPSLQQMMDDDTIGLEARVSHGDHLALKVWLRLLACSTQIETEIRKRLRAKFGITLSRFDYLAQLHRHPEGLRMNALSRNLMVTGGNVTGLTDELEREGLVARKAHASDRRAFVLTLTPQGRKAFLQMAAAHEAWLIELMALPTTDLKTVYGLLGVLRMAVQAQQLPVKPTSASSRNQAA